MQVSSFDNLWNSSGKIYGVSISWMLMLKKFRSGSHKLSNGIVGVLLTVRWWFNNLKLTTSVSSIPLKNSSALNLTLWEVIT